MLALRLYVFLGAFLLFTLEPLVGRLLLPEFGGAFHVWTTSLMFFQALLFLAYAWAHLVAPRIGRVHAILWLLPLLVLPPGQGEITGEHDVLALLWALVRSCALPFVALATTSVTAQAWLARSSLPGKESPYFLYALSNVGSLAALVLYALVIEPLVGLSIQRVVWSVAFGVWVLSGVLAWRATTPSAGKLPTKEVEADPEARPTQDAEPRPSGATIAYWIVLSACPSALLMAVTNLIAIDAGNVPLVWVVPLALYLLTFVWAFGDPPPGQATRVPPAVLRIWPHFAAVGLFFWSGADTGSTWMEILLHAGIFFVITLAAHTELYRVRPAAQHLTLFYLVMSFGGWVGGAFVALVAPTLFTRLLEYPLSVIALGLAMLSWRATDLKRWIQTPGVRAIAISLVVLIGVIAFQVARGVTRGSGSDRVVATDRSFYGIYQVLETRRGGALMRDLVSGTTCHGRQFMDAPGRAEPLSYYHREGPLGDVMRALRTDRAGAPLTIGAVGLGVGAAAAYVEPADRMTFYEIDAADVAFAERYFHYLEDARGEVDTVVGDARVRLRELEHSPEWDLLLVDAFAGDAIPTHLVTLEAVELDRSLVRSDGYLLFHISNRYYDLLPVLARIASELDVPAAFERDLNDLAVGQDPAVYFLFAPSDAAIDPLLAEGWVRVSPELGRDAWLWTDDHVNTLAALLPDWQ